MRMTPLIDEPQKTFGLLRLGKARAARFSTTPRLPPGRLHDEILEAAEVLTAVGRGRITGASGPAWLPSRSYGAGSGFRPGWTEMAPGRVIAGKGNAPAPREKNCDADLQTQTINKK